MSLQIEAFPFIFVMIFGCGFLYFANELLFHKYAGPESRNCALMFAIVLGMVTLVFASMAFV